MDMNLGTLITDMTSEEYHKHGGTYSSSQLKDLLEDPEYFHKKYVLKTIERLSIPAFDIGSYFHCAILEPEKLSSECAVFGGKRLGKVWDDFKEANKNRAIITETELEKANLLISAVQSSPIAMNRIARGNPEVSTFNKILVSGGDIFHVEKKFILSSEGWVSTKKVPKKGTELTIKVRADLLADSFILDLKSTSGNAKNEREMMRKVADFNYDLSASLYLDMFTLSTGRKYREFIWTFASKDLGNCKSYIASDNSVAVGRAKWRKCVLSLANGIETNWSFEDSMGILGPVEWEMDYLKQTDGDLL